MIEQYEPLVLRTHLTLQISLGAVISMLRISTIRLVLLFKSIANYSFSVKDSPPPPPTAKLKQNAVRLSCIDVILIDFGRIAARA